jgi:MFS family permease
VFGTAELLLAVVVISEELGPATRGWGIGALFAIKSCGVGLAAGLLPLAAQSPQGWRWLYLVGLAPLADRLAAPRPAQTSASSARRPPTPDWQPLRRLARDYRALRRVRDRGAHALGIAAADLMGAIPAAGHGWSAPGG